MHDAAIRRREILTLAGTGLAAWLPGCAASASAAPASSAPPQPTDRRAMSRFRGFNLLEKFAYGRDGPYEEWDFDFLAEHGFNFVRLPTDYRCWTERPGKYREKPLADIDRAIGWARSRGMHVNLALHRAPGYSVNRNPPEALDLWGEEPGGPARAQFLAQWRMLAERFRDVPASVLSFNLLNEPAEVTGPAYRALLAPVVAAIREFERQRLIVADGSDHGRRPVPELAELALAQSTRGYAPFQLTHYRADWVDGAKRWPTPRWPAASRVNQYLFGEKKPHLRSPLVLHGYFPGGAPLRLHVARVSERARVSIRADGASVLELDLLPKAGAGEWKTSEFRPEWNIHQAAYDRAYEATLPRACREIRVELIEGDWMTFSELVVGNVRVVPDDAEWGKRQLVFDIDARGELAPRGGVERVDGARLYRETVEPWLKFSETQGVAVHVGEWGAHRHTPHAVVLAWMRDCLANWSRAELGWALWNLRGSFGCVDSDRADVKYEVHRGRRLDRQMLELLKR